MSRIPEHIRAELARYRAEAVARINAESADASAKRRTRELQAAAPQRVRAALQAETGGAA